MQCDAALKAIAGNAAIFATDKLELLEPSKLKTLKLPGKLAYFYGGAIYHRVAVVCPRTKGLSHEQQVLAGLLWANRVSNGQKTVLYLVGKSFSDQFIHLVQLFGPQIEVRLVYFSSKLAPPLVVASREGKVSLPRFSVPPPRDPSYWERFFNPVEKAWFKWAVEYFRNYRAEKLEICVLDNWVSIRFRGLEIVRIGKKESRLRIALTTRYPREIFGTVGNREEKEGWFNASGQLNSEFVEAFEQRLGILKADKDLFARVCPEKQRLEYAIRSALPQWGLDGPVYFQLDVSRRGETSLVIDVAGRTLEGNLVVVTAHTQKDFVGFLHALEQLIWAKTQLEVIRKTYFPNEVLTCPQTWLVGPRSRVAPELDILRCLLHPREQVKMIVINEDWAERGVEEVK